MNETTLNQPLILIVDDSPANLLVLTALLRNHYRIKTATDGPTALTLAATADQPQLILLDMMMPGMDGAEVLVKLREQPVTTNIPVIFVTADTSEKSQVHSFELGADDYLTKPVVEAILLARVHNILRREELEKETRRLTQEAAERELLAAQEQLLATQELLARSSKLEFLGKLVASFAHDISGPIGNCITTTSTMHNEAQSLRKNIETKTLRRSTLLNFANSCEEGIGLTLRNLERAQLLLSTLKQQAQDQATSQTRRIVLKTWLEDLLLTVSPVFKDSPHRWSTSSAGRSTSPSIPCRSPCPTSRPAGCTRTPSLPQHGPSRCPTCRPSPSLACRRSRSPRGLRSWRPRAPRNPSSIASRRKPQRSSSQATSRSCWPSRARSHGPQRHWNWRSSCARNPRSGRRSSRTRASRRSKEK